MLCHVEKLVVWFFSMSHTSQMVVQQEDGRDSKLRAQALYVGTTTWYLIIVLWGPDKATTTPADHGLSIRPLPKPPSHRKWHNAISFDPQVGTNNSVHYDSHSL